METSYVFFLGSHAALSATECWTVLHAHGYQPTLVTATQQLLVVTLAKPLSPTLLATFGGTDRIGEVLGKQATPWTGEQIYQALISNPLQPTADKMTLGISTIGGNRDNAKTIGQDFKNIAREFKQRVRFILAKGKSSRLNAAQVIFNQLVTPPNAELTLIALESQNYLVITRQVQDIVAYEQRDTQRPARNAKVGMLPPKLAQIMLNLAVTTANSQSILDPFCGMGTILQEGWIMGHKMFGSDVSPEMIAASQQNLDWLASTLSVDPENYPTVALHDITKPLPFDWDVTLDAVVTEPYLGRPLRTPLFSRDADRHIAPLAELYLQMFENIYPLLKPDGMVLMLLPAFKRGHERDAAFTLLPTGFLDAVVNTGYSFKQLIPQELAHIFTPSARGSLLYSRPDALVGRELTLWQRS